MEWLIGILAGAAGAGVGFFFAWRESRAHRKTTNDRNKALNEAVHWSEQYNLELDMRREERRKTRDRIEELRTQAQTLRALAKECRDSLPVDDAISLANSVLAHAEETAGRYEDRIRDLHRPPHTDSAERSVGDVRRQALLTGDGTDVGSD